MAVKHRDIVVRLTQAQYEALAGAVAERALTINDNIEDKMPRAKQELAVLNRAWESIKTAWYRAGMGF